MTDPAANIAETPPLTIIVVSYNTREMTLTCLRSVRAETRTPYQLIVVDNASADGSVEAIASEFPNIELIASPDNLGFARANNMAAKRALGTWLLLLNPDTEVYSGAIDRLLDFAESLPEAGIYGGRTVFPDGSLNIASCWNRITPWSAFCNATGLSAAFSQSALFNPEAFGGWKRDSVRHVDIVVGCFLLLRLDLWRELGGFDLRYFMYGEEADLCLRARRLGYRPMITPEATIMHVVGAASATKAKKTVLVAKAKVTLIRDHWPKALVPLGVFLMWLWAASRFWASRLLGVLPGESHAARKAKWSLVWRERRDWLAGY